MLVLNTCVAASLQLLHPVWTNIRQADDDHPLQMFKDDFQFLIAPDPTQAFVSYSRAQHLCIAPLARAWLAARCRLVVWKRRDDKRCHEKQDT